MDCNFMQRSSSQIPRWIEGMAWSPLVLAALAVALSMGIVAPAQAIVVTDITTNAVVFSDAGFEDDTVGIQPDMPPAVGSWFSSATVTGTSVNVIDDASPGAYSGSHYLKFERPDGVFAGPNVLSLRSIFSAPVPIGDTLNAAFAFQYQSTASNGSSVIFEFREGNTRRLEIVAEPDWGAPTYYTFNGAQTSTVTSSLAVLAGQWQKLEIAYTAGSEDVTLTVNGVSETLIGALSGSGGAVDNIRFATAASNTFYYLDGIEKPAVPGDFDGDADVDGADFVAWQTNLPTASGATLVQGDADGDGDVDGADFTVWQTHFPTTPSSSIAPVPEPDCLVLLLSGCAIGMAFCLRSTKA